MHRNFVHSRIDDGSASSRRTPGLAELPEGARDPFPLILVHYDTGPNEQAHPSPAGVDDDHAPPVHRPVRDPTRAVTTYTVASTRFWMVLWPVIRRFLQIKSTAPLMSEDTLLRERRGAGCGPGATRTARGRAPVDIRTTISVAANNLVFPDPSRPSAHVRPSWRWVRLADGARVLPRPQRPPWAWQLRRQGLRVEAHARLLPHEGADRRVEVRDGCPAPGRPEPAAARGSTSPTTRRSPTPGGTT